VVDHEEVVLKARNVLETKPLAVAQTAEVYRRGPIANGPPLGVTTKHEGVGPLPDKLGKPFAGAPFGRGEYPHTPCEVRYALAKAGKPASFSESAGHVPFRQDDPAACVERGT
jgi:hypothetical protein